MKKQYSFEKSVIFFLIIIIVSTFVFVNISCDIFIEKVVEKKEIENTGFEEIIDLPEPKIKGEMSLEEAIKDRRSIRSFDEKDLNLEQISQLLWAAQGITDERGHRASPSAGALYPLELYIVKKDGAYHYIPEGHKLEMILKGDLRKKLKDACLGQQWIEEAPINIVITGIYERTTVKYGERGIRYVHLEAGHACQNILLQSISLGLGAIPVGGFHDREVQEILNLEENYIPSLFTTL
ncbi:unnamed protein product [marine sediment metagenome]|uniref:Nitroreductase domain-containing protein n=1 Tax=marine sediment metagenome TaxID=412755 RepID=X0ZXM7_9ZZZZ